MTLECEVGPAVRFRIVVGGKEIGTDLQTPLADLASPVVLEGLGRFVTKALAASIVKRSDCGP